jgi:hypothetical protein
MENSILWPVLFATLGALAVKLLELLELGKIPKTERPDLCDWVYWASFLFMPLLGGFVAYMYVASDVDLKPILACNVGISAPLILRAMAQTLPKQVINPGAGA